ncbi:T9SS type A sorting domain-containing protein [Hymenobacter sp. BT175]|uniref:T9SS type A sorting domain-containing protein n=1 Tax=Hymenobacter translucens TaxID=2886507 RepID=UPI001D0F34AB|nr:T9SS type A sorting domain-containing protein [Hymenobacter translucens]MCC2545193.1 T9SS type A sorting domain-containing protein [Hymenobacter translucens]
MKKILLSALLLSSIGASAQMAPWVLQNNGASPQTPPEFFSRQMHTVSANVAWQLLQDANGTGNGVFTFSRTANGGALWEFGSINGTVGYSAAGIHAMDAQTAFVAQYGETAGGGEILKTTNGGNTWTKVTTASQFRGPAGFANWVYFFDANNGVSLGDPTSGSFEVLTTSNGGTTWTRVPAGNLPAPLDATEYALVGSYYALGNTIWAGTTHLDAAGNGLPTRVLKSTDRGLTWTASALTPISEAISRLAFVDQNNGLAFSGMTLIRTTDGGATWSNVNYTGNFNHFDFDVVDGTNMYISVGSSVQTVTTRQDYGSSISTDNGQTWRDLERGEYKSSVDVINRTTGYAGAQTDAQGAGGVYKLNATALPARNASVQQALGVYPNPSATGVFQVKLNSGIKADAQIRVIDAVGREVYNRQLNPTAVTTLETTVDLSREKSGIYTLELRTAEGVAQQKVVIQ